MRTSHVKASDTEERWFEYDASEHILGRMATKIATQLMGKDRPTWTPSEHGNTHVVVVNAGRARLTGKKDGQKEYQTYSGYPGGQYIWPLETLRERSPPRYRRARRSPHASQGAPRRSHHEEPEGLW